MNCELMAKMGYFEMFITIIEYPDYEVSNYGNVRNKKTGKILKPSIVYGYYRVGLMNNNKRYQNIFTD